MSSSPSAVDAVDKAGELGDLDRDRGSPMPSSADAPGAGVVEEVDGDVFTRACFCRDIK
jgi:hypothetical protein